MPNHITTELVLFLEYRTAVLVTMRALSKEDLKPSRENMRGAASLWKKRQTLSLPPTCTQLVLCEKGKFSLDGSFSKNAPYKQKIIFHLTSIGKIVKNMIFLMVGSENSVRAQDHRFPRPGKLFY